MKNRKFLLWLRWSFLLILIQAIIFYFFGSKFSLTEIRGHLISGPFINFPPISNWFDMVDIPIVLGIWILSWNIILEEEAIAAFFSFIFTLFIFLAGPAYTAYLSQIIVAYVGCVLAAIGLAALVARFLFGLLQVIFDKRFWKKFWDFMMVKEQEKEESCEEEVKKVYKRRK